MEIIKRTSETEKQTVSTRGYNEKMQVSLNNYGHIVLRFFDDNFTPQPVKWKSTCKYCQRPIHTYNGAYPTWYHDETDNPMDDTVTTPDIPGEIFYATPDEEIPMTKPQETLIVLDAAESRDLIQFIKERLQ